MLPLLLEPIPPSAMVFSESRTDRLSWFSERAAGTPRRKTTTPASPCGLGVTGARAQKRLKERLFQDAGAMGAPRFASILRNAWKYTPALHTEKAVDR